ncbi:unnamed protein product [Linum trigynum]|uniref:Uncharacterized protein n=1 Tax=Linum trigynum TaxID=586398 RepID=A0AAV2DPE8_9ROSI
MNIPVPTTPHLTALAEELSKKNGGEGEQVNEQIPSVAGFAPRSHPQGSSVVLSPETILRNSAKTFRNLPSIIRKRSSMTRDESTSAAMATSSGSGVTSCSNSSLM